MNDGDTGALGFQGTVELNLFSSVGDGAPITGDNAANELDQGGFPCPVFSDQRVNFPDVQVKPDPPQGMYAPVSL